MKKVIFSILGLLFATTFVLAQDQKEASFYTGSKIDLKAGIQLKNSNDYLIITGYSGLQKSGFVEVFLKRGDDAVSIKELKPIDNVLAFIPKEIFKGAEIKSGDQVVIKFLSKEIYYIPVK